MIRRVGLMMSAASLALASCATFEAATSITITEQTGAVIEEITTCTAPGSAERGVADDLASDLGTLEADIRSTDAALSANAAEIGALEAEIADLQERTESMAFILANFQANLNVTARAAHLHDELGGDGNWPVFSSGTGAPDLLASDAALVDLGAPSGGGNFLLAAPSLILPPVFISAVVTLAGIDSRAADRRREVRTAAVRASRDMRAQILEFQSIPPGIRDTTAASAIAEIDEFVDDRFGTNMFGDAFDGPQWGPLFAAGNDMGRALERELARLEEAQEALDTAAAEAAELLAQQRANTADAADLRQTALDQFEETCDVRVISSPTYSDTLWYTSSP